MTRPAKPTNFRRRTGNIVMGVPEATKTSNSASIAWTTNVTSDSEVEWGTTTAYTGTHVTDATLETSHSLAMSGLDPETLYHYRVKSRDAAGNLAVSGDYSFDTLTPGETITHTNAIPESSQSKPAFETWWLDPDTAQYAMRISNKVAGGSWSHHVYSDLPPWSCNMTYYVLNENNQINVYRWSDDTLVRGNIGLEVGTYMFSVNDDDAILYYNGASLMKYSVSGGTKTAIHDFSDVFSSLVSSSTKRQSDDGRYMAIGGAVGAGYGFVRYDFTANTHSPATPIAMLDSGECGVSPDGDYLILNGTNSDSVYPKTYNPTTGALIGLITGAISPNAPHFDVMKDSSGNQWFLWDDGNLNKVLLPSGNTPVTLYNVSDNMHISGAKGKDWCIVSTASANSASGQPFFNEIFKVYLDSTQASPHVERLFHHRSRPDAASHYWKQAHACISPDAQYAMFTSSWLVDSADEADCEVYALRLPDTDGADYRAAINHWTAITPTKSLYDGTPIADANFSQSVQTMYHYDPTGHRIISMETWTADPGSYPYTIYTNSVWALDVRLKTLKLMKVNNWWRDNGAGITRELAANDTDPTPTDRHPSFTVCSYNNSIYYSLGLNSNAETWTTHPNDNWRFDLGTRTWTQLTLASYPLMTAPADQPVQSCMAYDSHNNIVLLYPSPSVGWGSPEKTWLLDPTNEAAGYVAITNATLPTLADGYPGNYIAFDSLRKKFWLFGAGLNNHVSGGNELWWFDAAVGQRVWTQQSDGTPPPARLWHGFCYDSKRDLFILHGGSAGDAGTVLNDTWIYDPVANLWTDISATVSVPTQSGDPTYYKFVDMAYDEYNDCTVISKYSTPGFFILRYVD